MLLDACSLEKAAGYAACNLELYHLNFTREPDFNDNVAELFSAVDRIQHHTSSRSRVLHKSLMGFATNLNRGRMLIAPTR